MRILSAGAIRLCMCPENILRTVCTGETAIWWIVEKPASVILQRIQEDRLIPLIMPGGKDFMLSILGVTFRQYIFYDALFLACF